MADLNKALLLAVRTGKAVFGVKETLEAVRSGKARLVVLASNCLKEARAEIGECAALAKIPVLEFGSTNEDLGIICGKRFPVAALAINDPGNSDLLSFVEKKHVK